MKQRILAIDDEPHMLLLLERIITEKTPFSILTTNNPLEVCLDDDVLIAHKWNGKPLSTEHGGPARVIIPKRYAWKGAKFIREITFLDRDILGFWEVRGYSNTANPGLRIGLPTKTRCLRDFPERLASPFDANRLLRL